MSTVAAVFSVAVSQCRSVAVSQCEVLQSAVSLEMERRLRLPRLDRSEWGLRSPPAPGHWLLRLGGAGGGGGHHVVGGGWWV
eukprot:CAMPEP_0118965086 /NCGR_PEP_ID=MMETSP1173-20130426/2691_1 /TAXON_ID=1034831 /ORGANISM="Rhizochromulina marina cf, Strain CCMP1243" /LENGTH=81 /DNA_ID=CAMNT_0006913651 /DNA_START=410 /DNA_END=652 /DNA_ORIENTATION=+